MVPHIAALLNECLSLGEVPKTWRDCLLTVIPKSRGDMSDPSSWRGIAERNTLSKLLSGLVAERLTDYLTFKGTIPPEQRGFVRDKSTMTACRTLLEKVGKSTRTAHSPLYAISIDYKAAFYLASRSRIIGKLQAPDVAGNILRLTVPILREGNFAIEDGVGELPPLQTTGVAQGDGLVVSRPPQ